MRNYTRRIGEKIAQKYEIGGIIGGGGMGVVYGARHCWTDREVAIKILRPDLAEKDEIIRRFLREAKAAAKVRHAHVVDVLDMGRDRDGTVYLVLERLNGKPLNQLLRQGRLTLAKAVRLLHPIMDALSYAHELKIVHRDVKPSNIFLADERGGLVPKLLDFGVVKMEDEESCDWTQAGAILGTPSYMSPEQVLGKTNLGAPSDVWSMAIVFYESVTGKRPFRSSNPVETIAKILREDPPSFEKIEAHLPSPVARILLRAWSREPKERPSMSEFAAGLFSFRKEEEGSRSARRSGAYGCAVDVSEITRLEARLRGGEPEHETSLTRPSLQPVTQLSRPRRRAIDRDLEVTRSSGAELAALSNHEDLPLSDPSIELRTESSEILLPHVPTQAGTEHRKRTSLGRPWLWVGAASFGLLSVALLIVLLSTRPGPLGEGATVEMGASASTSPLARSTAAPVPVLGEDTPPVEAEERRGAPVERALEATRELEEAAPPAAGQGVEERASRSADFIEESTASALGEASRRRRRRRHRRREERLRRASLSGAETEIGEGGPFGYVGTSEASETPGSESPDAGSGAADVALVAEIQPVSGQSSAPTGSSLVEIGAVERSDEIEKRERCFK